MAPPGLLASAARSEAHTFRRWAKPNISLAKELPLNLYGACLRHWSRKWQEFRFQTGWAWLSVPLQRMVYSRCFMHLCKLAAEVLQTQCAERGEVLPGHYTRRAIDGLWACGKARHNGSTLELQLSRIRKDPERPRPSAKMDTCVCRYACIEDIQ